MAIPSLLDSYIDETYQRLVQTAGGTEFADGLGNPITFGTTNTGSLLLTASVSLNTIEFTKGDNTKFSITVDTGSGGSISGDYVTTSSFNAFTSSVVTTASFNSFTQSYNTGSFSGSFIGNLVGTATTASHAVNFTIESTLTIDQTLTDYHVTVADAPTTWGIFERATGSYTAAIGKYTIYSGTNARAGEFMTVWNGTTVNFTDVATTDIGSTANLTLQSSLSGGNIRIDAVAASSGPWTIKMLVTYL